MVNELEVLKLILGLGGIGILFLFMIFNTIGFITGAPYAPIPMPHLKQLLPKLALGPASLVYDLGSGDGRVLLAAAKNGSPAVGFEINPVLFCWSWLRVRCKRLSKKISLCPVSFWQQSLRPASIIFAFLLPEHMAKLEKKLEKEIKSGTVVITYLASLPHWKAYLSENGYKLYKAPAIHGMMS